MNEQVSFQGSRIVTVRDAREPTYSSFDEVILRIKICSILFSRINYFNLHRFFNYCDRNKSLKLERGELEIGLLTILQLLNEQMTNARWPRFTFYHVFLPEAPRFSIEYFQAILYLAETLLQYVRTMPVAETCAEFFRCLDRTLSNSLTLYPELTQIQTATVFGRNVCWYFVSVIASPVLLFISPIRSLLRKSSKAKILRNMAIHLSSISLILSIANFVIYYIYFISPSESNQLEVYWPLGSILSILIILYVHEFASFHRTRYLNGNRVEQTFEQAQLDILEIRSTPNPMESIEFPFPIRFNTNLYQVVEQRPNEHHPTLYNYSISNSFIRPKNVSSSQSCHYVLYGLLLIICLLSLVIHSSIPTVDRLIRPNQSSRIDQQWAIRLNQYFYIATSLIFYSALLAVMMLSAWNYGKVLHNLQFLFLHTDLKRQGDFQSEYYFNLRRRENLEYFLRLFRRILSSIDENHVWITSMTCALLLDIGLILTVVIRVFILRYKTDLLTVWCSIDVIILSIFIMTFIIIVVLINKLILHDFIQYLRNFRKDLATLDSVNPQEANIDLEYLQLTIEHIESVKDQYSVKLLGFLVDHSLASKLGISILTGISSAIVSFTQQE